MSAPRRRQARRDCEECHGFCVTPTSQGNRPCSLCGTTESDIDWSDALFHPDRLAAVRGQLQEIDGALAALAADIADLPDDRGRGLPFALMVAIEDARSDLGRGLAQIDAATSF